MKTERRDSYFDRLFNTGADYSAHKYYGVHRDTRKYVFRVFAPNARAVYLISDVTGWDDGMPMERVSEEGVWEARLYTYKGIRNERVYTDVEGMRYRYKIVSDSGVYIKCDPYSFATHIHPEMYSVVYTRSMFRFNDRKWEEKKQNITRGGGIYSAPVNVYEIHLGSFLKRSSGDGNNKYLNYREIADKLVPYAKQMGYTHVELMPVCEHVSDESCGYRVSSYFSPTSRFGSPDDFKYFVNKLHNNGIGVIMDWVLAHFSGDPLGLEKFDGTTLYEYSDDIDCKSPWGTRYFDINKQYVRNFLISNILYWIEEYHIDGVRCEAISSMLYLDYDKADGSWRPNKYGSNENIGAIDFLKQLNYQISRYHPEVFTVAEESSVWNGVTHDVQADGLGFTFKWNTAWSFDMFEYMSTDPWYRRSIHSKLTFPMMSFFGERYILPIAHHHVSNGNGSLINKMFGDYNDKFANLRAFLTMQMTFPGKKLTFMGCEYGQFKEWTPNEQLEWFMLDFEMHSKLQRFCADLNHRYLRDPRLYSDEFSWNGFKWIYANKDEENVIAFRRYDKSGNDLVVVINFSGAGWNDFNIPVSGDALGYRVVLNSRSSEYGGGYDIEEICKAFSVNGYKSINIGYLPPFCGLILEPIYNNTII